MNFDLIVKLGSFAGLLVAALTSWKLVAELLRGGLGHARDEYKFAHAFFKDLDENPRMHPFLKQKGYQAIAGDVRLSTAEIEYLLTLHDSARSLKDYVMGRPYLEHLATAAGSQVDFKPKYATYRSRLGRKIFFFVLYVLFYLVGTVPLALPFLRSMITTEQALLWFVFSVILFFPAAFLALRAGVRVARAEVLVKNQYKHSRGILVTQP